MIKCMANFPRNSFRFPFKNISLQSKFNIKIISSPFSLKTMANNIEEFYTVVEAAITDLGVAAIECRDSAEPGAWALMRANQEVWIDCWYIEEEDRVYFQVLAPVFEIPANMPAPFYREVLEINYNLFGVAFGIYKDMLALKVIREAEGMDKTEALNMITRVGNYAAEFGGEIAQKYLGFDPNEAPQG